MSSYRRAWYPGGTYFFTINAEKRDDNDILIRHIILLRAAVNKVRNSHPFHIHAWCVLPNHMHCVIELPPKVSDFSTRIRLIKSYFTKSLPDEEYNRPSKEIRGERGIWQRRFWEHQIIDQEDFSNHIDYVHFNPVHHNLVKTAQEWEYSTYHHYQKQGLIPANWTGGNAKIIHHIE